MADADSLYELSSDQDVDPDAIDGDVENDDTADDGYVCILDTLDSIYTEKREPEIRGIRQNVTDKQIVATILLLCDILKPVNMLSLYLQEENVNFTSLPERVKVTIDSLTSLVEVYRQYSGNLVNSETEFARCDQLFFEIDERTTLERRMRINNRDLTPDAFLEQTGIPLVYNLVQEIEDVFSHGDPVLAAFGFFNPQNLPERVADLPEYGNASIQKLVTFYGMPKTDTFNGHTTHAPALFSSVQLETELKSVKVQLYMLSVTEARRKSKKKKLRRPRGIEKSSGDSDSQTLSEDQESHDSHHHHHHHHHDGHVHQQKKKEETNHMSGSGAEADTEGQGSQMDFRRAPPSAEKKEEEQGDGDDQKVVPAGEGLPDMGALSRAQIQKTVKELEMLSMVAGGAPKNMDDATKKRYQFWETQPVPRLNEKVNGNEEIEQDKPTDEIRQETYSLPQGFRWDTLDISDPLILKELYTLLNENYVEDDDNMFRFDYSPEFLQWALQPPGWQKDWHCGVRVVKSSKLVGFISAVPAHVKIYDKTKHMVEINFLCVHKKLRSKRVAPVLIREITRRVHLKGLFQAVYTAGVVLPKPVACCRYWHRSLNPKKLIEVKFSHLTRNMTMQRTLKLYKLPDSTRVQGFRPFTPADVIDSFKLLCKYLNDLDLAPVFSEEEFRHWFIPRKGIIDSYVVENNGTITDFVSFYTLPSTVMHHPVHKTLKAAYSFYNVATVTPWFDLMQDALIVAKNSGFDVFNALDLMQNKQFLEKLKFGIGDGNLQYYLYNWRCTQMEPNQVGLVLQ